uniref:cutinase family protein n=1 Tax=Rhodococcus erythropolis TaxID=1833 RepID=UPI00345EEAB7
MKVRRRSGQRSSRARPSIVLSAALVVLCGLISPIAFSDSANATHLDVPLTSVSAVAAGADHSCALMTDRTVSCWGRNIFGTLGDGTKTDSLTPVKVVGINDAVAVALTNNLSCVLRASGKVSCWGDNASNRLGNDALPWSTTPVDIPGIAGATAVSVGIGYACAIRGNGTVVCWGRYGNMTDSPPRVEVPGIADATSVDTRHSHVCVSRRSGAVACWGDNSSGQLGDGTTDERITPTNVSGIADAVSVKTGGDASCAVRTGGKVNCWGSNGSGKLGDGTEISRSTPVEVRDLGQTRSLTVGSRHACAVTSSGITKCWGNNWAHILGIGGDMSSPPVPAPVVDLVDAVQVAAGTDHTCAIRTNRTLVCWGMNTYGQLGDGTTDDHGIPVTVLQVKGDWHYGPEVPSTTEFGCDFTTYFLGVRGSGESPQPGSVRGDIDGRFPYGMHEELANFRDSYFYASHREYSGMGQPVAAVARHLESRIGGRFVPLGISYPAVPVKVSELAYPIQYRNSVDDGAQQLVRALRRIDRSCTKTKPSVVVAGYSQGAHVIEDALATIQQEHPGLDKLLTKVVLIASPIHHTPGTESLGGARTVGALAHTRKPSTATFAQRHPGVVTSICRAGDLVCDAKFADGLSDPTKFFGVNPETSLGARIHTSYALSDIPCPYTGLQQFTTICAANSVLRAMQRPLNMHTFRPTQGLSTDQDLQYSTRPGQQIDFLYRTKSGTSGFISGLVNWRMYSTPADLGTFTVGEDGAAIGTITIPEDAIPGEHTLVLRDEDGTTFSTRFTVLGPGSDQPEPFILIVDGDFPDAEAPPEPGNPGEPGSGTGSLGTGSLGGS